MNPSDDEEVKDITDEESEEIDELLEPKAIPDERIVRHAEKNDSYREAPTLENDEEIVQPPLDPPEEEVEVVPEELTPQQDPQVLVENVSDIIAEVAPDLKEEIPPAPLVSQVDIAPESVPVDMTPMQAPQAQVTPVTTEPVVYHTLSGGPETLNHTIFVQAKEERAPPPTGMMYASATSGYTIPDPHYIPPQQPDVVISNNFGIVLLLGVLALIGIGVAYVYFYMPATFNEFYDAIGIIKDQIFKK